MPLKQHDQTPNGTKACGGSCIMCVAEELGTLGGGFGDLTAKAIYGRIWRSPNDESLVSKVADELKALGLKSELIEDENLTGTQGGLRDGGKLGLLAVGFSSAYTDFEKDVQGKLTWTKRKRPGAFKEADFDGDARIMLIVAIAILGADYGKTHWVLARRDGMSKISIMNPDGGTESLDPGLLTWMNGPPADALTIGKVPYMFTGLALRVTK